MYEGLTRELLDYALPADAEIQIVDGFVFDPEGNLSPQIDCMLVRGKGVPVPYTTHYKWPVNDLIAVFEIKKNLYVAELSDSHDKLREVLSAYSRWIDSVADRDEAPDVRPAFRAFALLTGIYPRNYEDVHALPEPLQHIFHVLIMEHLSPVRIVFGYDGFVDEYGLREGFIKFLDKHGKGKLGFGIGSLPTLVVCGRNSIVKMNGQPYISKWSANGWWKALASNSENPLRLLLELIWTRLSHVIDMTIPPDDTLDEETFHLLLSARIARQGEKLGWEYDHAHVSKRQLAKHPLTPEWEPTKIDDNQYVFLNMLTIKGSVDLNDASFLAWINENELDVSSFVQRLTETSLVARAGNSVRLVWTTLAMSYTPDGQAWASPDVDRLQLWANQWQSRNSRSTT